MTTAFARAGGLGKLNALPPELLHDLLLRAAAPQAGHPEDPTEVIARWFNSKPPFAKWFTRREFITLAASAGDTDITAFVVPEGYYGVLRFFSNMVGNIAEAQSVTFRVMVDNGPLHGFAKIQGIISPSITAQIELMDAILPGRRVSVTANNATAQAIQNVEAFIRGWYWPIAASESGMGG